MPIFDTHAHYDDEKFDGRREELIEASFASGVKYIVNASSDIKTSLNSIALSELYGEFYAAVGIHPHECEDLDLSGGWEEEIRRLSKKKKVVAIGEIGLDYHYDLDYKEKQLEFFDAQISLAMELGLPVIIHDREAHGDTVDMLAAHPGARGIIHSFSGSAEMAKQLSSKGFYISFSGSVTFKNASKILEAVRAVPDDLILTETDAPYLAPVPHRGEVNYSGNIPHTLAAMASARGISYEKMESMTFENAKRCFSII